MIASRKLDECIRDDKRWVSFRNGLTGKILVEHFLSRHVILRCRWMKCAAKIERMEENAEVYEGSVTSSTAFAGDESAGSDGQGSLRQ